MNFQYLKWDESLSRALQNFSDLMSLFNFLLLQASGDVDKVLEWMKYLQGRGFIDDSFDLERFREELAGDFSLATEMADLLVERGVPFREAHGIVGRLVRWCEQRGGDLRQLTVESAAEFHPALGEKLSELLDPATAVERRGSRGGTARAEIDRQIDLLRRTLP